METHLAILMPGVKNPWLINCLASERQGIGIYFEPRSFYGYANPNTSILPVYYACGSYVQASF